VLPQQCEETLSPLSFTLQLGTLMSVLLGVTLVRLVSMLHYAMRRRVYPGFRILMFPPLLVFLGMAALLLRAKAGDSPLLAFFTSAVLLAHPVLEYHGLGEFGRMPHLRAHTLQNSLFVLLVCLAQTVDVLFDPSMERRVVIFSAAALVLTLRIALELPWRSRRRLPGMWILCLSYLFTAGFQVLRGFNALTIPGFSSLTLEQADVLGVYSVFFRILQSMLEIYVVFAMNSAMLEDDLHAATSQIEHLAHTDALTGVANRRGMELLGMDVLSRSFAEGKPAAVLMLDLDWFKRVNDSLGHAAGDELLRCVAGLCVRSLRREDVFARYGGEEFVVVAPRTSEREARALAERIRAAVSQERFAPLKGAGMTVSIGVACARAGSLDDLLRCADEALYAAKQAGRDRVVLSVLENVRSLEPDEA
jgi:diguanylate cyclase (GGDEF)-like protein